MVECFVFLRPLGLRLDVVARHRSKGVLTWKLIHQIEEEVLSEVRAEGRFSNHLLQMICAPAALSYPNDDRPVSFESHDFVPIVFSAIDRAWQTGSIDGGTTYRCGRHAGSVTCRSSGYTIGKRLMNEVKSGSSEQRGPGKNPGRARR
ncbi:DUF2471 family protein [Paraburkholderia sp. SARCC-3016]|uniref:DUF2471 family protein n=1 Tax=Paraburkholderia sp. SARCC-3016 TaxID=3058611 RepID=UPI0028082184|nr:DUF2471 family protein [Paraburkholderia sp. SARCC-3016]MDQ7979891.1 DUF2471 family protein [Paraburkholderia sp. SARCC-3016]